MVIYHFGARAFRWIINVIELALLKEKKRSQNGFFFYFNKNILIINIELKKKNLNDFIVF
jgi:hypothetical protein